MKNFKSNVWRGLFILIITSMLLTSCGAVPSGLSGAAGVSPLDSGAKNKKYPPTNVPTAVAPPPPATGHIVFVSAASGRKKLYLMNADGSDLHQLTTGDSEEESPRWSPDGTRIAYASTVNHNTDIYVIDPSTKTITRLTNDPARDSSPAWSPDGKRIAFESFQAGVLQIYVVNVDGSGLTRLTNDNSADTNPAWSPGNGIVFMSSRNNVNAALYLIQPDGGGLMRLTNEKAPDSDPVWSPDGSMIAYRSFTSPNIANICVVNRDGSNQHCLTNSQWVNGAPAWSSDGTQLAVRSERGGASGIDLINVKDGTVQSLSVTVTLKGDPIWSPDDARLVFEACPVSGQNQACADNTGMELYEMVVSTHEVDQLTNTSSYNGEPDWTAH
jgi:Tol biopolymer transport system component